MSKYDSEEKRARELAKSFQYLDNLTEEGYLWEFARRTRTYREAYERFIGLCRAQKPDYDLIAECLETVRTTKIDPVITVKKPLRGYHLATVKYTEPLLYSHLYYSLPDYHINYRGFNTIPDIGYPVQIIGRYRYRILMGFPSTVDSLKYQRNRPQIERPYLFDSRYSKPMKPYGFLSCFLSPENKAEDTIFVGISKTARREDLNRMVEDISQYFSKEKPRRIQRKWKSYLIIYDLRRQGWDSAALEDVLPIIDDTFADAKNIKNGYKAAVELIEKGQYKTLF